MATRTKLIRLKDGDRRIAAGRIDTDAVYVFTHGFCAELAYMLHKATGWPIVGAGWWDDGNDGALVPGCHYGVEMPDDRILDIEGPCERHKWAGRWGIDGAHGQVTPKFVCEHYPDLMRGIKETHAEKFAAVVLATHS